jgi:uncharacterized protein (TIGR02147 family)
MQTIFSYTDYRRFILDWYELQQASESPITYRTIARAVGFHSPAHITMILKGKTNLPAVAVDKFIRLMHLRKREGDFFSLLVGYNQAKTVVQKKQVYKKMVTFKECGTTLLNPDQYEYYQKWYYAVIHDILSYYPFRGNFNELARMVEPSITAREAKSSINLLERLKFIEKKDDCTYTCHYPGISVYAEGRPVVLSSYAETMIDRAKHALRKIADDERAISWAGFSVSAGTFKKMKEEARAFRKKLVEMAQNDPNPERAFHLNLQIFPVSKRFNGHVLRKASE